MGESGNILHLKQGLGERAEPIISQLQRDDICFFRFLGGNPGDSEKLVQQLSCLKAKKVLLIGIFRFPFRFEGKKRLNVAIAQYHKMRELCDAVVYFHSDGMMDVLEPGTPIQEANRFFEQLEDAPVQALRDMIELAGEINIDLRDIHSFIRGNKGPLFIRTFEGESFDEPLKYTVSTPYLPHDFADGAQMIVNIGCAKDVDMAAFQQINLRINDLFHKTDLLKLGTYYIDEPGRRFKITLVVNGIKDPYPRPQNMKGIQSRHLWVKRKWEQFSEKSSSIRRLYARHKQQALQKKL